MPGAGHSYLGGFIDPKPSPTNPVGTRLSNTDELANLPGFDASLMAAGADRPLSFVQLFGTWGNPVYSSQLYQAAASGAIPVLDWACDSATDTGGAGTDQVVVNGHYDQKFIVPLAQRLAATHIPMLLRWFPDPNAGTAADQKCLGSGGAAEYVAAFTHIRQVFAANGATNVGFVWSVLTTSGDTNWSSYFPGSAHVDWIGADGFHRGSGAMPSDAFTSAFASWYKTFSGAGKPMIITDTGAGLLAGPDAQASYLNQIGQQAPAAFPAVKAIGYMDSPDALTGSGDYALGAGAALDAFQALARAPYFTPARRSASVSVSAPSTSIAPRSPVKLTAVVTAPDQGGSLAFSDNGSVIPGCAAVQVALSATCTTSWSAPGSHSITVRYSGDARDAPATSAAVAISVATGTAPSMKPRVPAVGKSYLGAWVEPLGNTNSGNAQFRDRTELQDLPTFNSNLSTGSSLSSPSRDISIVHVYQGWTTPTPIWQLRQVMSYGAIPMVDWYCGDTDANVAAGVDDAMITQYAQQLAALQGPVFLRWYWEMNFTQGSTAATCLAGGGAAGYVAAFRHIWTLFQQAGATNVSFVWAPGSSGDDQDMMNYFPGSAYVDWIGIDGYWREASSTLEQMFETWYSYFSGFGLPMMITETGAASNTNANNQTTYFGQVLNRFPTEFPLIRGFLYFDSHKRTAKSDFDYSLTDGSPGLAAFAALDQSPRFQPELSPTSLNAPSPTPVPVVAGQELDVTASFVGEKAASDLGGSLSFTAREVSPVPGSSASIILGCDRVGISLGFECDTDTLPAASSSKAATYEITARYTGDAEFGESTSPAVTVKIHPAPATGPSRQPKAPTQKAYLGADVRPQGGGVPEELANLPSFEQSIHRRLAIVGINQTWDSPVPVAELGQIAAGGAFPLITWNCAATSGAFSASDSSIVAGTYDSYITSFAQQLAAFPAPLLLRWGPDPNLPSSTTGQHCVDSSGAHGYQAAFQHIHDLFQAAGANNVGFVWSVSQAGGQGSLDSYYPGSNYVDWIADDAYLNVTPAPPATIGPDIVQTVFSDWYSQYSASQYRKKPLMMYTGAIPGEDQAGFLPQLAAQISSYPQVKAMVYEDAPAWWAPYQYQLDSTGMAAFAALAVSPGFLPPTIPTGTNVAVAQPEVAHGQPINLAATVKEPNTSNPADGAGAVTFFANGKAIPQCANVLLGAGATCTLKYAKVGANTFTASYSGDAAYGGSGSLDANATVDKVFANGGFLGRLGNAAGTDYTFGAASSTLSFLNGALNFNGQPTIGSISSLGNSLLPGATKSPPGVPLGGTGSGTQSGRDDSSFAAGLLAGTSGNAPNGLIVLICTLLALLGGGYIVSSWARDRRRARRLPAGPMGLQGKEPDTTASS